MSKLIQGTQWLNQKFGKSKGTVDNEFEILFSRQDQIRESGAQTIKHLQMMVENFNAFQTTLQFVAEDFNAVFENDDQFKQGAENLIKTSAQIETRCVRPFQAKVNGPDCIGKLVEFQSQFDHIKSLKKTRDAKVLEYDYHKDNVQKLSEKAQKNPEALPKAKEKLQIAQEDYETTNESMKRSMTSLISARNDDTFDPVFQLLLDQLITYQTGVTKIISELSTYSTLKIDKKKSVPHLETESLDDFIDEPLKPLDMKPISVTKKIKEEPKKVQTTPKNPIQSSTAPKTEVKKPMPVIPQKKDVVPSKYDIEWHYLNTDLKQEGPISVQQMKKMYQDKKLKGDSYIFGGEMSDWEQISKMDDLVIYLKN